MAQVKIQSIIDKLDYEMKRALEDAITRVVPDLNVDRNTLYREFYKAVGRKSSTWVTVNDSDVQINCHHCGKHN